VNSYLFGNYLKNDLVLLNSRLENKLYRGILGMTDKVSNFLKNTFYLLILKIYLFFKLTDKPNSGRLSIFTDTYCLDDYQLRNKEENCFWLISSIIK
jgi:hypothetical protein